MVESTPALGRSEDQSCHEPPPEQRGKRWGVLQTLSVPMMLVMAVVLLLVLTGSLPSYTSLVLKPPTRHSGFSVIIEGK